MGVIVVLMFLGFLWSKGWAPFAVGLIGLSLLGMLLEPTQEERAKIEKEQLAKQKVEERIASEEKAKAQARCRAIHSDVVRLVSANDPVALSRYSALALDQDFSWEGTNDGCRELRTALFVLKEFYDEGTVPAPREFEYAGRKIGSAGSLLTQSR